MKTLIATAALLAVSGLLVVEACRAWPMASTLVAVAVIAAALVLSRKRVTR